MFYTCNAKISALIVDEFLIRCCMQSWILSIRLVWTIVITLRLDTHMSRCGLFRGVETATYNFIVIDFSTAMNPCNLNLVIKNCVDRVCRIERGSLRDEILLSALKFLKGVIRRCLIKFFRMHARGKASYSFIRSKSFGSSNLTVLVLGDVC